MSDPQRARFLGYEIQHIFAQEILTRNSDEARAARTLLTDIGFDLESRSNKIALLRSPETRDALANAPSELQQVFVEAGFGSNIHEVPGTQYSGPQQFRRQFRGHNTK